MEVLGTYDPVPKPAPFGEGKPFKDIKLDTARAKYWLGVGAQPSDPAWRLLSMVSGHSNQSVYGRAARRDLRRGGKGGLGGDLQLGKGLERRRKTV